MRHQPISKFLQQLLYYALACILPRMNISLKKQFRIVLLFTSVIRYFELKQPARKIVYTLFANADSDEKHETSCWF